MKKLFISLILLMAGVMATYATDYGLKVAGVNVTSTGNVSAGQSSGTIKWDGSTLTFTNVTISSSDYVIYFDGGSSSLTKLTVKFVGINRLTSTNHFAIRSKKDLILDGERYTCANLIVESTSSEDGAIYVSGSSKLTIKDLFLKAIGKKYCITGDMSSTELLIMETFLRADCGSSSKGAICDFKSFENYDDSRLVSGSWNSSKGAVVNNSGNPLSYVQTDAPLVVGGCIVPTGWDDMTLELKPTGMTAGKITFNGNTNTLTLDGVKGCLGKAWNEFNGTTFYAIYNTRDYLSKNLKIVVKGTNEFDGSNRYGIHSDASFSIEGYNSTYSSNVLTMNMEYTAIQARGDNSTFTIKDVTLTATSSKAGYYGIQGSNTALIVNQSKVKAVTPTDNTSAIDNFRSATLTNTDVKTAYCCFRNSLNGFGTLSGLSKTVEMEVPDTKYNVWVLGHQITSVNPEQFGVEGYSGYLKYYPSEKKLTFDGVKLNAPEGNTSEGVKARNGAVETITLTGSNTVTTKSFAFVLYGDVTIEGDGSLTATSTEESGISMTKYGSSCTLTLNVNNKVKFLGASRGIWGHSGYTSDLVLKKAGDKSDYYFKGTSNGAVYEVSDLKLTDMDFFSGSDGTPGCYFDGGYVRQNGGEIVKGSNVVNFYKLGSSDRYGIFVGGTEVTNCNQWGVGSKYITAGGGTAVTYNDGSKTLTLNGATINTEGGSDINCIRNVSVDGLTINVASDSRLEPRVDSWGGFYTKKNTTITGAGKLTVDNSGTPDFCFSVSGGSLTLKDINMSIAGDLKGYTSGGDNYLYIDLAAGKRVEVAGSVYDFTDITFRNGSKLLEPEGAWYDNTNKFVTTGSGKATGIVFADKDATGIEGVLMSDADLKVEGIFDAQGRQLQQMQKGVNILRMSDGTTRKVVKQ